METTITITLDLTDEMQEAILQAFEVFEHSAIHGSFTASEYLSDMHDIVKQAKSQLVAQ